MVERVWIMRRSRIAENAVRVLVVDDHSIVRQALAAMLAQEADIEIVGDAANGQEAVALTRQHSPDVVLMDINMPVLNGIEATRAIHAESPATCIIGLSMFERDELAEAMRDAGAMDYVTKSVPPDEMLVVMRGCYARLREDRPPDLAA